MRNKTITIWDEDTEKVKAIDMTMGRFYRVVESPDTKRVGALACRTGRNTVCCWTIHPKVAFTISLLEACDEYVFIEARKFSVCNIREKNLKA
jgi:hypothetical protein